MSLGGDSSLEISKKRNKNNDISAIKNHPWVTRVSNLQEKLIEITYKGLVLVHPVKIELEWKNPAKLAFLVLAQLTLHGRAPNL